MRDAEEGYGFYVTFLASMFRRDIPIIPPPPVRQDDDEPEAGRADAE